MQTQSPFFEQAAKAMEQAIGLAQTAGEEAKAAFRAQTDRWASDLDLVRRDEFDAMRAALTAEIAELRAQLAALRTPGSGSPSGALLARKTTPVEPARASLIES